MVTPRKLLHVIEAWGRVLKSTTSQFNLQGIFPEAGLNRANYAHVGIYREYSNFPFYEMNARKCIKKQESVILQNPDRRVAPVLLEKVTESLKNLFTRSHVPEYYL
jgi:hypothetical protein